MTDEPTTKPNMLTMSARIVESYVANNTLSPDQLPDLIRRIYRQISETAVYGFPDAAISDDRPTPPVKPRNSIRENDVICLECGAKKKMLRRHLRSIHEMDEATYKERWGLPKGVALVSHSYSRRRSEMAKTIGLGNYGRSG